MSESILVQHLKKLVSPYQFFEYPHSTLRGIDDSWEQIAHLGNGNIESLIEEVKSYKPVLMSRVGHMNEKINILFGRSGNVFADMANRYQNPDRASFIYYKDSRLNAAISIDQESKKRKPNTTTFNICGWCKYAKGTGAKNYIAKGNCELIHNSPEIKFDTPCMLHGMSAERITAEASYLKQEIRNLHERLDLVKKE